MAGHRAPLSRWYEIVADALADQNAIAVPGILIAMALDGWGHEAETLRRELAEATKAVSEVARQPCSETGIYLRVHQHHWMERGTHQWPNGDIQPMWHCHCGAVLVTDAKAEQ